MQKIIFNKPTAKEIPFSDIEFDDNDVVASVDTIMMLWF